MSTRPPFRRMLRIPSPANLESIDARVIRHLESLEQDSPHRMQEWIRLALRNQFVSEVFVLEKTAENRNESKGGVC
ncbi:hypothetical protein SSTU70S_02823 [Stutzerimonas stutzeri]